MINLNLLPPSAQLELKQQLIRRAVRSIVTIASLLTLGCVLVIGGTSWWLTYKINTTRTALDTIRASASGESQTLEQAIDAVNDKTAYLSAVQRDEKEWARRLIEITSAAPVGLSFKNLVLDAKVKTLAITGLASTRDTLIEFEQALEALSFVAAAEVPLTNLSQQSNINFTITATLK